MFSLYQKIEKKSKQINITYSYSIHLWLMKSAFFTQFSMSEEKNAVSGEKCAITTKASVE